MKNLTEKDLYTLLYALEFSKPGLGDSLNDREIRKDIFNLRRRFQRQFRKLAGRSYPN